MPITFHSNSNNNNNTQIHHIMSPTASSIFFVPAVESDDHDDGWSSSSIGRNSDVSDVSSDDDGNEFKGPLDTMDVLEEALPIKKGISKFYNGKSKSFTSLADISEASSSAKDLAKPKIPLNKKGKDLLANHNYDDVNHSFPPKIKTCLPPLHSQVKDPPRFDPVSEAPRRGTPWRSFSYSDLQCVAAEIPNRPGGIS